MVKEGDGYPIQWKDNIVELTDIGLKEGMLRTKNREGWKKIVKK